MLKKDFEAWLEQLTNHNLDNDQISIVYRRVASVKAKSKPREYYVDLANKSNAVQKKKRFDNIASS